ncbi:ABC transporter ATP-binding protein [Rhizobium rhizogenes]|uniref:ABC transporter ATP-binding protein n=1 Tax=Rhizobium rhizogenes TaxID=359 RepID=UPI001F1FB738|nr:ABC transporter ATP-binding protein [Rhizobium rhizogenes]
MPLSTLSDRVYKPFESLVRPLDIPYAPLPSQGPLRLLLHFISMFRWILVAISCLAMFAEGINLFLIWSLSAIVDGVSAKGPNLFLQDDWGLLLLMGLLLFPALPLSVFLTNTLTSQAVSVCMPAAIQWQGHKAVERQDLGFFNDLFAGQVASRLSQAATAVQQQVVVAFQTTPYYLVQFFGSMFLLASVSLPLAFPVFLWIATSIAIAVIAVPAFVERSRKSAGQRSLVVGSMTDLYSNIQMVKQFAAEDSEAGLLRGIVNRAVEMQQKERRVYLTTDACIIMLNVFLWFSMLFIGFKGMLNDFISTGQFVAALYITQRLTANARAFLQMGQQVFQAVGTIRDAMPMMTSAPTINDAEDARPLAVKGGEIVFNQVNFSYRSGRRVITDLSLEVRPGEKIGLVGLSGAGKSTLVHLLLRFYELESGCILIDGQNIQSITQQSLRKSIGIISQDVVLLHRSVGDNIRYGRPEASQIEVQRAASLAHAEDFITDLLDGQGRRGYQAFVGDRGVTLSGGQRQRLAIARVILKDAPILILDEATSALDSESEAAIQGELTELMEGKTVIAIAHRLSTIAEMDRIVVLDSGRIVEQGAPHELLLRNGHYSRLWKRQTGGYISDRDEDD